MKKHLPNPIHISLISELHRMNNIALPEHPLVSVGHFNEIAQSPAHFSGKIRYGQSYYDFDEGGLSFLAPGQLCYEDPGDRPREGDKTTGAPF